MQTKKLVGIALAAALVGSMAAVAATSVSAAGDPKTDVKAYGIAGAMNSWGGTADEPIDDIAMNDDDGDGIYVGSFRIDSVTEDMITELTSDGEPTGKKGIQFKVRGDHAWDFSWGAYEESYDRTQNSQTNCLIEGVNVGDAIAVTVKLDTTKVDDAAAANADSYVNDPDFDFDSEGYDFWPVTWEVKTPKKIDNFKTLGVIGSFVGSDWKTDIAAMTDDDGDGVFEGVVKGVEPGTYDFKVRADGAWDLSWGAYEAEYDRTQNSQTNLTVTVTEKSDITVKLDTNKVDDAAKENADSAVKEAGFNFEEDGVDFWPVTFTTAAAKEEESEVSTASGTSETSTDSEISEDSEQSEMPEFYETQISDYIFFDNSKTKWETVCAYWWHPDYAKTVDLEGNLHGCHETVGEDGTPGFEPDKFPGTKMTQIKGTDIWQVRIPFNAQKIIFSNGYSDEEVAAGAEAYQTEDLPFSATENAGQMYVIDVDGGLKAGRGVEKTKSKYQVGEWVDYTGEYIKEEIGEKVEPSEDPVESSTDSEEVSQVDSTDESSEAAEESVEESSSYSGDDSSDVEVFKTGDIAMAAAFIAIAAAALGAVVLASKKKSRV